MTPAPLDSLSVCIIAHNEAGNIEQTLASLAGWATDVIVLDCGSTDATAAIARAAGARVHTAENDLPELSKNRCFALADREWIFSIDADEVATEEVKREIAATIERSPRENGFKIPRRNHYFGAPLMHGGNYPDRQLRLFRAGRGHYPTGAFHERLVIDGSVGELTAPFDHHPYPSFAVWMRKFEYYTEYGAGQLAAARVPITSATIRHHMVTRPLRRYLERLLLKRGIRDGVPGVLAATFDLMTHVVSFGKYWHAERRRGPMG
jgi:glycosyltransferase involved in cell wall biosynthesis